MFSNLLSHGVPPGGENMQVPELVGCCRELDEVHRAWAAQRKEAAWRLKRVELMNETEAKVKALREEQKATWDRIEAEHKEQLAGLRRDAEAKEQKLADQAPTTLQW